jgi:hypothetical protein
MVPCAFEDSLQRLGVDHIDILYPRHIATHGPDSSRGCTGRDGGHLLPSTRRRAGDIGRRHRRQRIEAIMTPRPRPVDVFLRRALHPFEQELADSSWRSRRMARPSSSAVRSLGILAGRDLNYRRPRRRCSTVKAIAAVAIRTGAAPAAAMQFPLAHPIVSSGHPGPGLGLTPPDHGVTRLIPAHCGAT